MYALYIWGGRSPSVWQCMVLKGWSCQCYLCICEGAICHRMPLGPTHARWLRSYIDGCADQFCEALLPEHLAGRAFRDVASWLFTTSGLVLIGGFRGWRGWA